MRAKIALSLSIVVWVIALLAYVNSSSANDQGPVGEPTFDRETATRRLRGAAIEGWTKIAREAIRYGASVDETDEYGTTPLILASIRGHDRVVEALLAAGANPNRENDDRTTPLFAAAANCNDPVVTALLRKGANPNVKNRTRQSALMRAAENGCSVVVKELLNARGIDLKGEDDSGRTAIDYANESRVMGLDYGQSYALIDDYRRAQTLKLKPSPKTVRHPVGLPRGTNSPRSLPRVRPTSPAPKPLL